MHSVGPNKDLQMYHGSSIPAVLRVSHSQLEPWMSLKVESVIERERIAPNINASTLVLLTAAEAGVGKTLFSQKCGHQVGREIADFSSFRLSLSDCSKSR